MEIHCFSTFSIGLRSWGREFLLPIWQKCFSSQYLWTSCLNSLSWCFDWITCSTKQPLFVTKLEKLSHQCQGKQHFYWCQLHHSSESTAKHTNALDHFVGNVGIQKIFMSTSYQEVLQPLHFANNTKQYKTDKGYKVRPIINHSCESIQAVISNETGQSIDEHMIKFKGHSPMSQCLEKKPKK